MILASNDLVVFWTKESGGGDLCIMDGIGRFTLVNEDEIDDLCRMLQKMKSRETHSIHSVNPKEYVEPDEAYL